MTLIQLQKLSKTFEHRQGRSVRKLHVLDDVSLTINHGEFVSLVGPSSCGKSTLLRLVAGLIAPESGQVLIDGKKVVQPSLNCAVVFQQFNLLPWRTALGNVEFGLQMRGVAKRERYNRAMDSLAQVGLSGFERYYPAELSGGMQQRVGLARALAVTPDILLMDEPFGSLDAQTRENLQNELMTLSALRQCTVFFVTHDIEEAIFLSDRVLVMSQRPGHIMQEIPVEFSRPRQETLRNSAEFAHLRGVVASVLKSALLQVTPDVVSSVNVE